MASEEARNTILLGVAQALTTSPGLFALGVFLAGEQRVRAPQINIGAPIQEALRLRERGLDPRISTDPFTGGLLVSARDQDPFLGEIAALRELRRISNATDFSPLFFQREALIEGLRNSAVQRGFFASTEDIPEGLRGGVVRATADSPLEFRRSA